MQDFRAIAAENIALGQQAQGVLAVPVVAAFFAQRAAEYLSVVMNPAANMDDAAVAVARLRMLQSLHDHLTRAVRDGLDAAASLSKQQATKQGA